MSTGELADLDAILAAAEAHDVLTIVDATQAAGWLPLDAGRFDFLVAAGYKWLISPRGTAWMTVAPERLDDVLPAHAGWFAGDDAYKSYIGPPLRLASDARRLDTSPAWFSWVGAVPALDLLVDVGIDVDPRAQRGAGEPLPRGDGARAVGLRDGVARGDADKPCARRASRRAARRRLRVGFHLYNDEADADRAVDVLSA